MLPPYNPDDWDYPEYGPIYMHLRPELDRLMNVMRSKGDSDDKIYSALIQYMEDYMSGLQFRISGRDAPLVQEMFSIAVEHCDHLRIVAAFCMKNYTPPQTARRRDTKVGRKNRVYLEPKLNQFTGRYYEYTEDSDKPYIVIRPGGSGSTRSKPKTKTKSKSKTKGARR